MMSLRSITLAAMVATSPLPAFGSEDYPIRPVTIVVPWSAGGAVDIVARLFQSGLEQSLGQPVIIENQPGATGTIGHASVARAEPDGYTITLATNSTYAIAGNFLPSLPYDHEADFAPIAMLAASPLLLASTPGNDLSSVADVIAVAGAEPGRLAFASGGIGTTSHLAMELFMALAGIDMVHVPYQGGAPAATAVAGGEVDIAFLDLGASLQFIEGGQLDAVAVGSPERSSKLPDVPTIMESGLEGFRSTTTFALYAPAATPQPVIDRLHEAVATAAQQDSVREGLQKIGVVIDVSTPEELRQSAMDETRQWRELIAERGIEDN